ncbi:hypothetical protein [Glycomyces buryatensis]|uniref:Type II toxin-antitoxin system PemK/MazF family toxin n=1 Tax=Glycomyces buryatensis TaxID=2570927 RepID=A0A4S8QK81_9ACTN|nr:hypothetical protein [Glycomyces buryatensis]THV41154.1 hypothetical protein FAB82_12950 [Glycomyces buryatensis]
MNNLIESLTGTLCLIAVVGVIAIFVVHLYRSTSGTREARRDVPPPPDGPQVTERWWADFPHQDDPSQLKERPCLIIGYSGTGYWVLKCTTQAPREAHWRVPVDASWWSPPSDKDGYIDLAPFHLPQGFLKRKQGVLGGEMYRHATARIRWDRAHDFLR